MFVVQASQSTAIGCRSLSWFGRPVNKAFSGSAICGDEVLPIEDLKTNAEALTIPTGFISMYLSGIPDSKQNLEIKKTSGVFRNQSIVSNFWTKDSHIDTCGSKQHLTFLLGPKVCDKLLCPWQDLR